MILYKYRDFTKESKSRTLEILNDQELYFSSINSFNDPFDGKVHLRFDGKLNEIKAAQIRTQYTMKLRKENKFEGAKMEDIKLLVDGKFTDEYINNQKERNNIASRIQSMHNKKGVLSLSSKCDNILMWSHYTYNHSGVCFGFDFSDDIEYSQAKKVRYQTHYDDIWAWLHTDEEIVNRILYSKAINWQYEDEYRIVKNIPGTVKFKPESLTQLIFGSKMKVEDKIEIITACEDNNLKPKFRQALIDVESYKLNIIDYKI
ncbi:DUF2971 domain-containing protein [Sphingobacterium sp. SG20118]|uniref:DUF2971 domain-containing protein n=1 Tax=Sphingobacterium sp. SG20118 TaxID=3367156 RepID=UPI0037DFC7B4